VTYAAGKRIVDADSHLMEWPGFLTDNVESRFRDAMPDLGGGRSGLTLVGGARPAEERAALESLGEDLVRKGPKWHAALGAVDPSERSRALDLLGFEAQVIYSSLCAPLFDLRDRETRRAGYRAHNRAVAGFCADDERLLGVAMLDLDDVDEAIEDVAAAHDLGLRLAWLPARAPGGRSPGHLEHDRFWAVLAELRMPFVLHVGSGAFGVGDEWMDDGRPLEAMFTGAEIIGSKDFMVVYQWAERFLSVLVLDGVLERHPTLNGGAIELGAGWVPSMLRRLDHAVAIWQRSETRLAEHSRTPSAQASAQLRFTPYPFEDVGWMCAQSDPALYLFSSDYPHAEGGRDPIGRFDRALADASAAVRSSFYGTSAASWLGIGA
jgi:hypothetical protein